MIVSHAHKFIFLKTRKTAGSSLEHWLRHHLGPEDIATPDGEFPGQNHDQIVMNPLGLEARTPWLMRRFGRLTRMLRAFNIERHHFFNHMRGTMVRRFVGERIWNEYFVFCVERNPYEKMVSDYYGAYGGKVDFRDFVLNFDRKKSDWDIIADGNDDVIVDEVIEFKNLHAEFAAVCRKLGLKFDGSFGVYINAGRNKKKDDYRDLYDEETKDAVYRFCKKEIEYFGYEF